jgi:hypothetical protein
MVVLKALAVLIAWSAAALWVCRQSSRVDVHQVPVSRIRPGV